MQILQQKKLEKHERSTIVAHLDLILFNYFYLKNIFSY